MCFLKFFHSLLRNAKNKKGKCGSGSSSEMSFSLIQHKDRPINHVPIDTTPYVFASTECQPVLIPVQAFLGIFKYKAPLRLMENCCFCPPASLESIDQKHVLCPPICHPEFFLCLCILSQAGSEKFQFQHFDLIHYHTALSSLRNPQLTPVCK